MSDTSSDKPLLPQEPAVNVTGDYEDSTKIERSPRSKCNDVLFNIFVGQLIAIGLVSGGVFTQNLQSYGLNTPILQLTFMYFPLSFYLIFHFT